MRRIFKTAPFVNKKNKQISIVIPKKKITAFKNKIPKKLKIKIMEVEW